MFLLYYLKFAQTKLINGSALSIHCGSARDETKLLILPSYPLFLFATSNSFSSCRKSFLDFSTPVLCHKVMPSLKILVSRHSIPKASIGLSKCINTQDIHCYRHSTIYRNISQSPSLPTSLQTIPRNKICSRSLSPFLRCYNGPELFLEYCQGH